MTISKKIKGTKHNETNIQIMLECLSEDAIFLAKTAQKIMELDHHQQEDDDINVCHHTRIKELMDDLHFDVRNINNVLNILVEKYGEP